MLSFDKNSPIQTLATRVEQKNGRTTKIAMLSLDKQPHTSRMRESRLSGFLRPSQPANDTFF